MARFPEVAWLAPEPSEPFKALIDLVAARFPDYPPYEGAHDVVIPHLTVAEGGVELQDRVEAAVSEHLPIRARAGDVAFLFEDDEGLWHEAHRFPRCGGAELTYHPSADRAREHDLRPVARNVFPLAPISGLPTPCPLRFDVAELALGASRGEQHEPDQELRYEPRSGCERQLRIAPFVRAIALAP